MSYRKNSNVLETNLNKNGVMRFNLNSPENLNALSENMMDSIQYSLDKASLDKNVRVIIIAGEGSTFSSGHDLKELKDARKNTDKGKKYFLKIMKKCSKMMQTIIKCPKPIIAEVAGTATAAGCQLVASCDLAYASNLAKFATPGVNIGLFCSTPMVAISRNLTNKHSMEMLLTGELISSNKAAEIGLINDVVEGIKLKDFVLDKAQKISKKSSVTLKIGKEAFYKQLDMNLSDAYDYASNVMVENMLKLDAKEGIEAFIEKRKPNWQDK
ncbi:enoyl-CoA hydratase [Candidatus Pelagibacter bacterium]|nr:enoyl-CoA hydratase [Candidatus Pelagibacter bacterium]